MRSLVYLLVLACGGHKAAPDAVAPIADAPPIDGPAPTTCTANGIPGACIPVGQCYGSRMPTGALCEGAAANVQCCTPRYADGNTCDPDAVPMPNAGLVEEPGDATCPAGMARVDTFCIDRFEASLVEGSTPWSPYFPPLTHVVKAVSLRGAVPQAFIKQTEAKAACAVAGKRLCSDVEWLRACQGASLLPFPYGATRQAGTCNDARATDPAVELYGTSAPWIQLHLDSPCLDQLPSSVAKTGAHAACKPAEAVFDLMGNLQEWTDDPSGTLRGGDFVASTGCTDAIQSHDTFYWDYRTGFRCCADHQ